jgi:NTE family protein
MNALILSGGGARAAYQVGVLLGVSDILPELKNPFPIISGTSAGAINAAALAAYSGSYHDAAHSLAETWRELEINHVFRDDWRSLAKGILKTCTAFFHQGTLGKKPIALLDNSPLRDLLTRVIDFDQLDKNIELGHLRALAITALGYNSGESVSFFQGNAELRGWRRYRRVGTPHKISVEHLLASSAIPAVFPTVKLSREYFGDGAMRQMAPISSALHLGADRVFVIGVSGNRSAGTAGKFIPPKASPSIAQILGQVMNAAFIDSLEGDIEHLEKINTLLELVPENERQGSTRLRKVETLIISPSKRLDRIAGRKVRHLPRPMRALLRSSGATTKGGGSAAASFLLFSHEYCHELIDLGYSDAMWERDKIEKFFEQS